MYKLFKNSIFLAFLSTALGGINSVVFKVLMETSSFQKIALYEAFFLVCFFASIKGWQLKSLNKQSLIFLFLGSFLQGMGFLFFYLSLQYLTPLEFSFLGRNQATFSILLGAFLLKEKQSIQKWFSIILLLLGAFTFTYTPNSTNNYLAIFFALLFCLSLSVRGLVIKKSEAIPINILMFWGSVFSFLIILALSLVGTPDDLLYKNLFELNLFFIVALSSLFSNAIGIVLYFKALERGYLSSVASIRALSPLFVAIYSSLFFEYSWTSLKIIGFIICLISMIVFLIPEKEKQQLESV